MPNPAPRSRIYAIANDYVEAVAEQNPLAATSMGVPGHDHEMTDFPMASIGVPPSTAARSPICEPRR